MKRINTILVIALLAVSCQREAVQIVGYDNSKSAWKIWNSWGTGWGDSGFGWIDYNFLPQTGGSWVFAIR